MTCDELQQDYTSFALGIAEDPERAEIREHLERKCPVCTPGIASAMATVTAMTGAVKLVDPPKRLRRRVSAMVAPEGEPKRAWVVWAPWAVTAIVSVALILVAQPSRRPASDLARLEEALNIINDPAARDVSFGEAQKPARGRVFVSPARGVVFIGASMPGLPRGRVFELWLLPATGNPVPAGTFLPREDASAIYVHPVSSTGAAAVAVTIEPDGGSQQPTTTPFIVARL